MEYDVIDIKGNKQHSVSLLDSIYNCNVSVPLIARVIDYQLTNKRQGTHSTKSRSQVSYTGKKMYRQKGTGGARHSDKGAPIFVGGGRAFSQHGIFEKKLPKKIRTAGLRMALSQKQKQGELYVMQELPNISKTKEMVQWLKDKKYNRILWILPEKNTEFYHTIRNIPYVDMLPVVGLNVYDVMKHNQIIIVESALEPVEKRLS